MQWNDCKNPERLVKTLMLMGVDRSVLVRIACACAIRALEHVESTDVRLWRAVATALVWTSDSSVNVQEAVDAANAASSETYHKLKAALDGDEGEALKATAILDAVGAVTEAVAVATTKDEWIIEHVTDAFGSAARALHRGPVPLGWRLRPEASDLAPQYAEFARIVREHAPEDYLRVLAQRSAGGV
jgi:hypothetical protein